MEHEVDSCGPGDRPRRFEEFLAPGAWSEMPGDWFSGKFTTDIQHHELAQFKVTWREVGRLGTHRIRSVRYRKERDVLADLILAEGNRGIFAPLMKWLGPMPEAAVYEADGTQVLVVQTDDGGKIPMIRTRAWIWGSQGPVNVEVDGCTQAIPLVAPGYDGYDTGLDWPNLNCQTWVWKGAYPGKIGVSATVRAWFKLRDGGLVITRAEFVDESGDESKMVRWPE